MCNCVSNNFYPFDKTTSSKVLTGAACLTVASVILMGLGAYLKWGMPATISLSSAGGSALLLSVGIGCYKKCSVSSNQSSLPSSTSAVASQAIPLQPPSSPTATFTPPRSVYYSSS